MARPCQQAQVWQSASELRYNSSLLGLEKGGDLLETFQHFPKGSPPKKGAKVSEVLIMNIGDANASGR